MTSPEPVSSPRISFRHIACAVLAGSGMLALAASAWLPWVRVSPGIGPIQVVLDLPGTVRTYRLLDLPVAGAQLYACWVILLAMLVTAWDRPARRRSLLVAAGGVVGVLIFLTLETGHAAVVESGLATQYPRQDFLSGAGLALAGAASLLGGIGVLALPVRAARWATAVAPVPTAAPTPGPTTGWSARPVAAVWWRRRGPVAALVAGVVGVALVVGLAVWLPGYHSAGPRNHTGDLRELLISVPDGFDPAPFAAPTLQLLDLDRATEVNEDRADLTTVFQVTGFRRGALVRWATEPTGTEIITELLQFGDEDEATQFATMWYQLRSDLSDEVRKSETAGVPRIRSVAMPDPDEPDLDRVEAIVPRGDIAAIIIAVQPRPADVARIQALARVQYGLL